MLVGWERLLGSNSRHEQSIYRRDRYGIFGNRFGMLPAWPIPFCTKFRFCRYLAPRPGLAHNCQPFSFYVFGSGCGACSLPLSIVFFTSFHCQFLHDSRSVRFLIVLSPRCHLVPEPPSISFMLLFDDDFGCWAVILHRRGRDGDVAERFGRFHCVFVFVAIPFTVGSSHISPLIIIDLGLPGTSLSVHLSYYHAIVFLTRHHI